MKINCYLFMSIELFFVYNNEINYIICSCNEYFKACYFIIIQIYVFKCSISYIILICKCD